MAKLKETETSSSSSIPAEAINAMRGNPNIKEIHFDSNGNYHFNAYDEMVDDGILPGRKKATGRKTAGGGKCIIVSTVSRAEALSE